MTGKWCKVCGRKVDLRKGFKLSENLTKFIPNSDYHYCHRGKCQDILRAGLGLSPLKELKRLLR